ncbi:MFS transporter [Nocardia amikacinitolerans]|uniref:MFS transporter n=1 Tax=Nocardia amikacinitolerans TaxID=756689 RepID=UPI0020A26AA6|nr:MFS transporter [Nocardia amikacinitolerans]
MALASSLVDGLHSTGTPSTAAAAGRLAAVEPTGPPGNTARKAPGPEQQTEGEAESTFESCLKCSIYRSMFCGAEHHRIALTCTPLRRPAGPPCRALRCSARHGEHDDVFPIQRGISIMDTDRESRLDTSPDPSHPPQSRPWVLALGVAIMLIEGWDLGTLGTVGPKLLDYQPWATTSGTIGVLGSILAAGMPLGAFLAGRAADTWGRRKPVVAGLIWAALSMLISACAPTLVIFALGLGLTGVAIGALTTLTVTFVADTAPPHRAALYVGTAQCGVALGGIIVPFVGRLVLPSWPFQSLYLVGALALVLIPFCWKVLDDNMIRHEPSAGPIATPLRALRTTSWRRTTALFSGTSFFVLMLVSAVAVWLPTLLVQRGFDLRSALEFTIAFNGGAIVGTLAATVIADRGRTKAATVACLLCACIALLALSVAGVPWLILALSALAGVGSFGTQNLLNGYIAGSYPTQLRGSALGVTIGIGRIGAIVGPGFVAAVTGAATASGAGFYALVAPAVAGVAVLAFLPALVAPETAIAPIATRA